MNNSPESQANPRILVIDDEESIRSLIKTLLTRNSYEVDVVSSASEARALVAQLENNLTSNYSLILLDINLGTDSGISYLSEIRETAMLKKTPVLMISGAFDSEKVIEAAKFNIHGCLVKPFKAKTLVDRVQRALTSDGDTMDETGKFKPV